MTKSFKNCENKFPLTVFIFFMNNTMLQYKQAKQKFKNFIWVFPECYDFRRNFPDFLNFANISPDFQGFL